MDNDMTSAEIATLFAEAVAAGMRAHVPPGSPPWDFVLISRQHGETFVHACSNLERSVAVQMTAVWVTRSAELEKKERSDGSDTP